MDLHLVVISGPDRGRILPLQEKDLFQIGISSAIEVEYRLRDPKVGRVHCEVEVHDGRVVLSDSGGPEGTSVNGERIQRRELHINDVIRIGDTQLRLMEANDLLELRPSATGCQSLQSSETDTSVYKATPTPEAVDKALEWEGDEMAHFRVGPLLGSGHAGRVFLAINRKTMRRVALKVIRPHFFPDAPAVQRFVDVLKPVLALRHPNLTSTWSIGRVVPNCWVSLEYVRGKSATQWIRRAHGTGPVLWLKVLKIVLSVARALDYLFRHGLRHGHLTPQNILIRSRGQQVKLADPMLGPALAAQLDQQLARSGAPAEELACVPPERVREAKAEDVRADLYGLGVTAYMLLTGIPPLKARTLTELMTQIERAKLINPSHFQKDLPEPFASAVLKLLSPHPEGRFQTPGQLLDELVPIKVAVEQRLSGPPGSSRRGKND